VAKARVKEIQKRDFDILYDLYRYRVLTTEQIRRKYFSDSKYYVNRKLNMLRNSGWISTFSVSRKDGRKGEAHHRITDRGITQLRQSGYPVIYKADALRVSHELLGYLREANNIMVELSPYGWYMRDSRETKERYNMNRGDQMHGTLVSPDGTEYGFFVLEKGTLDKNMAKVVQEIRATSGGGAGLTRFMIFAKGRDSIWHFIERANREERDGKGNLVKNRLVVHVGEVSGTLCVMDYAFGVEYLKSRLSDKRHFKRIFQDEQAPVHWLAPSDRTRFECIARYRDEEVYLVNLLDTDLMKVEAIRHYLGDIPRLQRFGETLRRVLVLTEPGLRDLHGELLGESPYIGYLELSRNRINAFKRSKGEMNNEPHHTGTEIDHEAHHGQESHRTRDCRSAERSAKKHVQSDETHIKGRTDLRPYRRTK